PLPAAVPIVWNDVVLVRSGEGLAAFQTGTGNLLWQHMPATRSVSLTKDSRLLRNDGFQELISRNEVFRILADDIHGRLTVADGTVYAVMEASQDESAGTARPMQTLGLPSPGETADVLVARGIRSGQELWQLNPATSAVVAAAAQGEKLEAGSVHLLGPPLVKAHEYFVCLAAGDTLLLLCGDTHTGEPEWAIPLGTTGRVDSSVIRRSLAAAPLAYAGGLLICGTASGAVAGVDLATRQVSWLRRYRRDDVTVADGLPQGRLNRHQNIRWWEGWRESSLHTDGQTVLVVTPESDTLRAIDAATGQELWVRPRAEGLLVGRLSEEAVYVLGRESLAAVRIADGSLLWHCGTGRPSGRPAVQGDHLLLPLETGEILRIHSGTGAAASAVLTAVG
ncbi:MAG: PQQ-binding-like beta-propeller repeat protein, partial [Planctomycetaceae bacterium]|nr:PQQ-binding-like beta-propeller repeat protein [Planctomycetaceae bacterium]